MKGFRFFDQFFEKNAGCLKIQGRESIFSVGSRQKVESREECLHKAKPQKFLRAIPRVAFARGYDQSFRGKWLIDMLLYLNGKKNKGEKAGDEHGLWESVFGLFKHHPAEVGMCSLFRDF